MPVNNHRQLLWLRVLALRNISTAYEPHLDAIDLLVARGRRKAGLHAGDINHLAWRYRRQISPELVPYAGRD
jgi:hypothetical protein